jgi:hypothetical protein
VKISIPGSIIVIIYEIMIGYLVEGTSINPVHGKNNFLRKSIHSEVNRGALYTNPTATIGHYSFRRLSTGLVSAALRL